MWIHKTLWLTWICAYTKKKKKVWLFGSFSFACSCVSLFLQCSACGPGTTWLLSVFHFHLKFLPQAGNLSELCIFQHLPKLTFLATVSQTLFECSRRGSQGSGTGLVPVRGGQDCLPEHPRIPGSGGTWHCWSRQGSEISPTAHAKQGNPCFTRCVPVPTAPALLLQ